MRVQWSWLESWIQEVWQGSKTGQKQAILSLHPLSSVPWHCWPDQFTQTKEKRGQGSGWHAHALPSDTLWYLTTCRSQCDFKQQQLSQNSLDQKCGTILVWSFWQGWSVLKSYEETGSLLRPLMLLSGFRSSWTFCEGPSSAILWLSVINISPLVAIKQELNSSEQGGRSKIITELS